MFHLSMAEDKLGSFYEDPEYFTKEFTWLVRSFALTWEDLQILLCHCCTPEEKQGMMLAARACADQLAAQRRQGHVVHQVGNEPVPEANLQWDCQLKSIDRGKWDRMINC